MIHKTFGKRKPVTYTDRPGAYLIPVEMHRVGIVRTKKGLFLLGGGKLPGETDTSCIIRECMEEIGCSVSVDRYLGSAETYTIHSRIGYFHPIQSYYLGRLLENRQAPIENDHELLWLPYEKLKGNMFSGMQNWALELVFEKGCGNLETSQTNNH